MRSVIYSSFRQSRRGTAGRGTSHAESWRGPGAHQIDLVADSQSRPLDIRGQYGYKPKLPAVGGTEVAGVIDAIGEGVEHLKPGQRVVVAGIYEGWADYVLAPAAAVSRCLTRSATK